MTSSMRRATGLAIVILVAFAGVTYAQDKTFYWARLDVDLTVLTNSDIRVVETQEICFTEGTFRYGSRNIPRDRLESITDVEVWEGNRSFTSNNRDAYGFTTSLESGNFNIRWYFPETQNTCHTFALKYTVKGGLRIYAGGDQLWWKAVFSDRNHPVKSSQVTVNLPKEIEPAQVKQVKIEAYGASATHEVSDSGQIVFMAQNIQPGQELEVRVQFPHGIVKGTAPGWQVRLDQAQTSSSAARISPGAALALVLGLAVLIVFVVSQSCKQSSATGSVVGSNTGESSNTTSGWSVDMMKPPYDTGFAATGSSGSGGDSGDWSGGWDSGGWSGGGDSGGGGGGGGDFG